MNVKMKMEELKDRLVRSAGEWADGRIDEFAGANPRMKTVSAYMKRGVRNWLAREGEALSRMMDGVSLFVCDESGEVDAGMVFDDLMEMFRESDEVQFGKGLLRGSVGKGVVRFQLPDNPLVSLLFGNSQAIRVTADDFLELKDLVTRELPPA